MGEKPKLKIYMLGRFAIEYDGKVMLESDGSVKKLWSLLGYLLTNRGRVLTQEELPELLCSDGRSNNPENAVKNLVYRLRKMLAESGLPDLEYIVQRGHSYAWNEDIPCEIDMDVFSDKCVEAKDAMDAPNQKEILREAVSLYYGNFLPNEMGEAWAVPKENVLKRMYHDCIYKLCIIAQRENEYKSMLPICENAIEINPFDENIYKVYIYCLSMIGHTQEAIENYNRINDRLYEELGFEPSEEMKELYNLVVSLEEHTQNSLNNISRELSEQENAEGAYFCEYQIFKDMYRVMARRIARTKENVSIVVFTVEAKGFDIMPQERMKAMETLKDIIERSLRSSDIYSRYSLNQYVVLLQGANYENSNMVAFRIAEAYGKRKIGQKVPLEYRVQSLEPK